MDGQIRTLILESRNWQVLQMIVGRDTFQPQGVSGVSAEKEVTKVPNRA